jgi:ABC-type multidrug transport system fused ATPase/permease subunit
MARPDASQDDLILACKQAQLYDYINSLPLKFKTVIGEQGSRLSAGQAQRLALARAYLKDAPTLVLDEPTSNLDPQTDREIKISLQNLSQGKTVLLIAHRISTVQDADQIIVLQEGGIIEKGSPLNLQENGGYYSNLIQDLKGGRK